jgi:hypothetical protein
MPRGMISSPLCVAVAVLSLVSVARADPASDAKDLFERGRQLRAGGDCAAAASLFHKAYELFPGALGPLRNAAECEEAVGRWASARRSWLELKRALIVSQDAKYAGWDTDADSAARQVAPRVAHLTVDVSASIGSNRDDLEVTVNGEALARPLVGTVLDRDPGQYVVRARLSNGEPAEKTVDLVTGESRVVRLVVAPAGHPLPPQPKNTPGASSSPSTPVGWVTLSLGLGALVGMGVAIGVRQDALATVNAGCPGPNYSNCSISIVPAVSRGEAASTTVTVLAVAGGIATGAGILMLLVDALSVHRDRERVAFVISPFGFGIAGSFQ